MSIKKKKNVIILTACMVFSFILYQVSFFLTLSSEVNNGTKVIQVVDHNSVKDFVHLKSEDDKYINEHGIIRGVNYADIKKYRPDSNNKFNCLSSKQQISFDQVNDDYCDCADGSDEPSTSACPTGLFYCNTQNKKKHKVSSVPSSRVNDGICDCCDGSDEWNVNRLLLSQSTKKHYRHFVTHCPYVCS